MTKEMKIKAESIVPDTSVIIEAILSKDIEKKNIITENIIIHEAILCELESQANNNREIGFIGLKEIKTLRELSEKLGFAITYTGKKPTPGEIRYAHEGMIDSLIRDAAYEEGAILVTADVVQSKTALAKGIEVHLVQPKKKRGKLALETFFDKKTMSVHLRENVSPISKKGKPGEWKLGPVRDEKLTRDELIDISKEIVEQANARDDGFVENDRGGSTIVQLGNFRTVITKPPFSDGWEITAVRPICKLSLEDYKISDKLKERISKQAEGILIAGSPGAGKTTFTQAVAEHYEKENKIIKTVEAPRDLNLSDAITQYALTHGTNEEVRDILLLCRPDYTVFDEMRNTEDFKLFTDLRLSGVGMIGVIHATKDIDAIQRFVGRIELGVIPQVVDTVLFIKHGGIRSALSLKMEVKVPHGMTESDLARPVVSVSDFETGKPAYELYTYGEETVVIPVESEGEADPVKRYAAKQLVFEMQKYCSECDVEFVGNNRIAVYVPDKEKSQIIGKGGKRIETIEKELGLSVDVRSFSERKEKKKDKNISKTQNNDDSLPFEYYVTKKGIKLRFDRLEDRNVVISVNGKELLTAEPTGKNTIKLSRKVKQTKKLISALDNGAMVDVRYL